jgi:drug/metabolite transporter superfamily protein YnfA
VSTTAIESRGALGQPRGVVFVVVLTFVTLGIYTLYWIYKTEEEMRQHTGEGIGGVLGLVVWLVVSPVMAFVVPSEVGKMYAKDGREPPVNGWTGLWLFPFGIFIIPMIVWFVKVQGALNRYWDSEGAGAAA